MFRLPLCCVVNVVVLVAWWPSPTNAVVGGAPAAAPEPDAAVVFVQRYGRSARIEGFKDDKMGYYSFLGLRYAEPPVGPKRFQRPIRQILFGEQSAIRQCLPCPQRDPLRPGRIIGNEDCLCLNVYAPKMPGDEQGCPVVFFIHGGNYKSGSIVSYGGQHLTQKDTILVTAQYRLGISGFFSTGQRDASGNTGLFDLHAALAWINDYIEFFGGDPTRVVVMGQGSGGSAASLLALSGEGRNAAGVIALSGTPLSPGAVRNDPAKHATELANRTGCPSKPAERLLICLRKLPIEKIIQADLDLTMGMVDAKSFLNEISGRTGFGARVEGEHDLRSLPPIVSEQPAESLDKKTQRCPLLTGVTSAETSRAVLGKYSGFLSDQLSKVHDFIKKDIIGGLHDVVNDVRGLIPVNPAIEKVIPITDYYQALFDRQMNTMDGLIQIAEATGDALFNFPAYQTVRAWSAAGPAYLYSFEHVGNLSKGAHFLPGVPLADEGEGKEVYKQNGPSHGDELAYIFEPLDNDGNPVGELVSSVDGRVRENFLNLISKFAHNLSPVHEDNKTLLDLLPFSQDNEQFIKIGQEIKTDSKFRFCEMGLWGVMTDRITGDSCQNIIGNLLKLPKSPLNPPTIPAIVPIPDPVAVVTPKLQLVPNLINNNKEKQTPSIIPKKLPFGFMNY
uniref:Carboxylesterase 16 n=1 Tax=Streltzoviella insularis TaxID=1206366 RepID=A0A7D5YVQ6_9NEOP|nr:carboxylesterase 16 [Streltzoviella insularis]